MAKITIWTCDHCKDSQNHPNDMVHVDITSRDATYEFRNSGSVWKKVIWCVSCAKEMGMPVWPKEVRETPAPTMEDMVRQIVAEGMPDG